MESLNLSSGDVYSLSTIFVCLIMSSFFSSAETAITSIGTLKAKHLMQAREKSADSLALWVTHPGRVLTTILIFNNVVNILASATATAMATRYFADQAIGIATGLITFLVLIFGEIIPKSFAKANAEPVAVFSMKIIRIIMWFSAPLIKVLAGFADKVVGAITEEDSDQPVITEDELEFMVSESEKAGAIGDLKKDIIESAFDFDETRVKEIMTPRTNLAAVAETESLEHILDLALSTGHSRIPIYRESIDHVVGIVLVKDLLRHTTKDGSQDMKVAEIMREAFFVPESKTIMDTFKSLQKAKSHMAVIIDEYGGTAGIVTMEDILEEIVGEIQDEYDSEEAFITKTGENTFEALGSMDFDEFIEYFNLSTDLLPETIRESESETLAGLMTAMVSEMPEVGQTTELNNLILEVTEVDRHKIEKIKITQKGLAPLSNPGTEETAN